MPGKTNKSSEGLANRALLDKMDKLRELGISNMVPLPQLVVVGDQSAGKSSVLESLTGFHFPRNVSLCTRHATEIICRREETKSIVISIHAVDADKDEARSFRRNVENLDAKEFGQIFQDAAKVMGISSAPNDDSEPVNNSAGSAFSRDVLRVEISGPDEDHLTVIDVPGMFENETPGQTTKADIDLVKDMVRKYINESRTIILAVVPCTVDIANQKILTYAKEADPDGKRTLGVLTKPDLAVEEATKGVVVDLVLGKRRDLQLGYCVVKNRGADDTSSSPDDRNLQERAFFSRPPWTKLPADRVGIPALKSRLGQLLMDRTKSEFPKVRTELTTKHKDCETLLKSMGEARSTEAQQRVYLGRVAAQFAQIKTFGLDAYYTRHEIFENEELKLITRIREINEGFGKVLYERGHTRNFFEVGKKNGNDEKPSSFADDSDLGDFDYENRRGDLYDDATFLIPDGDILTYIENEYLTSRGYEIGTFSGEMLPTTFKEQTKKWGPMARAHVSNAILIVHHFIRTVLDSCCPDEPIREELWSFLLDDLQGRYRRAVEHVEFLLKVEFEGKSITYDPTFNEALTNLKFAHAKGLGQEVEKSINALPDTERNLARVAQKARQLVDSRFEKEEPLKTTRRDIHNVLQTFYSNARGRFVDVVCQQVIDHFLLHAPDGPLAVLSQDVVIHMNADQLETIAGEDMLSKDRREKVTHDLANLKEAIKVLRG
ncbi:P-loop containing nucleoside triphosphate hydrolase protein [Fusarium tricinctum]|uniref:P-loop containing nucleoside triphosphate hydrolase protein n=1 Tax=Fusarium tricinctum TaxID=61284 RepID=A0A8K0WI80_9HYPO|nr:P-loop containing nucleoside triphosphate hydrolase protein [Fusarium tricinctum]